MRINEYRKNAGVSADVAANLYAGSGVGMDMPTRAVSSYNYIEGKNLPANLSLGFATVEEDRGGGGKGNKNK